MTGNELTRRNAVDFELIGDGLQDSTDLNWVIRGFASTSPITALSSLFKVSLSLELAFPGSSPRCDGHAVSSAHWKELSLHVRFPIDSLHASHATIRHAAGTDKFIVGDRLFVKDRRGYSGGD
jgi:hypothetical protein